MAGVAGVWGVGRIIGPGGDSGGPGGVEFQMGITTDRSSIKYSS